MPKNHILKFRVTKEQRRRIESNVDQLGYVRMATYLRRAALNEESQYNAGLLQKMAEEISWIKKNLESQNGCES